MPKAKDLKYMCADIQQLRDSFNNIPAYQAGDSRFMCQALMFLCEQTTVPKQKQTRNPTAWQKFFARGMRDGKPPAQIAEEWATKKTP